MCPPAPAFPSSPNPFRPRKQPSCTSANSKGAGCVLDDKVTPQSITWGSLSRYQSNHVTSPGGGGDSPGRAGAACGAHLTQAVKWGRDRERLWWGAAAWAEGAGMRLAAPGGGCFHGFRATGRAPPSVDTASSPLSTRAASVPHSPLQGLFVCYFAQPGGGIL